MLIEIVPWSEGSELSGDEKNAASADSRSIGLVSVPDSWSMSTTPGLSVAFPDPEPFRGDGFLPNVSGTVSFSNSLADKLGEGLLLSDRVLLQDVQESRIRVLTSVQQGATLLQLVKVVLRSDVCMTISAQATESQWPSLAGLFDDVLADARLVDGSSDEDVL